MLERPIRWVYSVRGMRRGEMREWPIIWVCGVMYVYRRDEHVANQVGLWCKGCV